MTFYRNSPRIAAASMTVVALTALAACSSESAPGSSDEFITVPGASGVANDYMNELYQAVVESGQQQLVLYGPSPSTDAPMNQVFMDRFPGIDVLAQDQPDAQTMTKLETEAESGNRIADIYIGGASAQAAAEPGICTPADVRTGPEGFEVPTEHDGRLTYYAMGPFGFVYNTDLVAADEAPQNWHDLLDPRWQGSIASGDPTVIGGLRYILTALILPETEADWGTEFLEQLAQQDLQIAQSEPTVASDVSSGRFPVGLGVFRGFYQAQKDKGAPLEFVYPLDDGGNYLSQAGMCLISDAPHADLAQLYVNWLYSPEGQQALAEELYLYGRTPAAPGPVGMPPLNELEHLPLSNLDPTFTAPYFEVIDDIFTQ